MDPQETLNAILEALSSGLHEEAAEHAANLADWLSRGGFPPTMTVGAKGKTAYVLEGAMARELCRSICREVLDHDEPRCDPFPNPSAD